jgi:hypothetical protein
MNIKNYNSFIVAIFILVITGCKDKTKNELLQGEWKFHSSIDLKTNKTIKKAEKNEPLFALINKDFIILTSKNDKERVEKYQWKMIDDSLQLIKSTTKDTFLIYLKLVNEERLEVDMNFLGKTRLVFKK